jgi:profilin
MQDIVAGLSGTVDKLYAEGLHVADERYVLTKAEGRSLYARKVRYPLVFVSKMMCSSRSR